jgi:hypothetical protein
MFERNQAMATSSTRCYGATIDLHPSFHTVRVGLGFLLRAPIT